MAQEQSGKAIEYVTVEIYDQTYHLSGQDGDTSASWPRALTPRCVPCPAGPHRGLAARGRARRLESRR